MEWICNNIFEKCKYWKRLEWQLTLWAANHKLIFSGTFFLGGGVKRKGKSLQAVFRHILEASPSGGDFFLMFWYSVPIANETAYLLLSKYPYCEDIRLRIKIWETIDKLTAQSAGMVVESAWRHHKCGRNSQSDIITWIKCCLRCHIDHIKHHCEFTLQSLQRCSQQPHRTRISRPKFHYIARTQRPHDIVHVLSDHANISTVMG